MKFHVPGSASEESVINTTPLIDMVFLLLIFFMLTTNLSVTSGFDVNLPKSGAHRGAVDETKSLVVYIDKEGRASIDGKEVSDKEILARAKAAANADSNSVIIIRADTNAAHGSVVRVMDLARAGGLKRLAIDTKTRPKSEPIVP